MELFMGWWAAAIIINNLSTKKTNRGGLTFVSFTNEAMPDTLVVDCSHLSAKQLTHHLKGANQKKLMDLTLRGDSSTDAVLNSIKCRSQFTEGLKHVSSNHFDIDSFTASWCCVFPDLAEQHDQIVREISRIGDFRELRLDHPYQHTALQLACWLNSEERRLFYKPFESKISVENGELDGIIKFEHFLPLFGDVLKNPEKYREQWIEEYERVVGEYATVNAAPIYSDSSLGIVTVDLTDPMHYYSLFSISRGFDIILSMYSESRYELEMKYTSMIDLGSRPTLPRVDMGPLAVYLNEIEKEKREDADRLRALQKRVERAEKRVQAIATGGLTEGLIEKGHREENKEEGQEGKEGQTAPETYWHSDRITDSGPILRLNSNTHKLTKAARYGHPYERPIYPSLITPTEMKAIVLSFFSHAYRGGTVPPERDHEWAELHEFNRDIDWSSWKP